MPRRDDYDSRPRRRRREEDEDDDLPRRRRRDGTGGGNWVPFAIVGGVVLFVGIVTVVVLLSLSGRGGRDAADGNTGEKGGEKVGGNAGGKVDDPDDQTNDSAVLGKPTPGTSLAYRVPIDGKLDLADVRVPAAPSDKLGVVYAEPVDLRKAPNDRFDPREHFVHVLDLKTGTFPAKLSVGKHGGTPRVDVSPDGSLVSLQYNTTPTGYQRHGITVWDTASGKPLVTGWVPYPQGKGVPDLVWHGWVPGGKLLTVAADGGFDVWAWPARARLHGRPGDREAFAPPAGLGVENMHENFAVSPDRSSLAVYTRAGFVMYDVATASPRWHTGPLAREKGFSARVYGQTFDNAGRRFAFLATAKVASGKLGAASVLSVHDAQTGAPLASAEVTGVQGSDYPMWWGGDTLALVKATTSGVHAFGLNQGKVAGHVGVRHVGRWFPATTERGLFWAAMEPHPDRPILCGYEVPPVLAGGGSPDLRLMASPSTIDRQ